VHIPDNLEQGKSRVAHLRKVIKRDATDEPAATPTLQEIELEALCAHMDTRYPGWEEPAPPEAFPETLKACKRLAGRIRTQMTGEGVSKRSRAGHRARLDLLEAHMRATYPEWQGPV
jgi:hypothetical protein